MMVDARMHEDTLRQEAVDLATDIVSLLVDSKGIVRPEDAYVISMECVRVADRIGKARQADLPHEARRLFGEAQTSAQKALVALDRAGALYPVPREEAARLGKRLNLLVVALRAMASLGDN